MNIKPIKYSDKYKQYEIKISTSVADIVIFVGNGFETKYYTRKPDRWGRSTKDKHIYFAANGPLLLTIKQWKKINNLIIEKFEELKLK